MQHNNLVSVQDCYVLCVWQCSVKQCKFMQEFPSLLVVML